MRIAWKIVVGFFAVLGAISSVLAIYAFVNPGTDQWIIWTHEEQQVLRRTPDFVVLANVDGASAPNEDLVQTTLTFWRDGGTPITAAMTRRPLRIQLPYDTHLVAWKVLDTQSSVPDNFHVKQDGDGLLLTWTVFDPDMAIRIALFQAGPLGNLSVTDAIGPEVRATSTRASVLQTSGVVITALVLISITAIVVLALYLTFLRYLFKMEERKAPRVLRWSYIAASVVALMVVTIKANALWSSGVISISSSFIKPVPFR